MRQPSEGEPDDRLTPEEMLNSQLEAEAITKCYHEGVSAEYLSEL